MDYEERLKKFIVENNIHAEHLHFNQSCYTVEDAAKAVKANIDELVKNICFIDSRDNLIVAIVKGEDKVNIAKVGKIVGEKPRIATGDEVLTKTGYPAGGTPSFGYSAIFLIDPKVMEKNVVYTGGGSGNSLIKISSVELQKANSGKIVEIRK